MTRVQCSIEAAPGVRINVDRDLDYFQVVLGRFVVELENSTVSVGEIAGNGYRENPLLRIVTSDRRVKS